MRLAASISLVLAALVLAGTAAGARDPRHPQMKVSAVDVRTAKSIALVRSDFAGGWKAAPKPKDTPPCSAEPDESKLVQTAGIDPTFIWKDGVTQVGSEVDVFRTAAEARLDWRLSTLKLMEACLLESARQGLGAKTKVTVASAVALATPKLGERSLHYRIVLTVVKKNTPPIVAEMIGVGVGRISVVLHAFSLGTPLPPSGIGALATSLAQRLVRVSGGV